MGIFSVSSFEIVFHLATVFPCKLWFSGIIKFPWNQRGATVTRSFNVVVISQKSVCNDHLLPSVLRWKWMSICILKVRIFTCFLVILFFTYMVPLNVFLSNLTVLTNSSSFFFFFKVKLCFGHGVGSWALISLWSHKKVCVECL